MLTAPCSKHVKTHNHQFNCTLPYCGRSFALKKELQRHIDTVHDKDACFDCTVQGCEETLSRIDNRRRHFREIHGARWSPKIKLKTENSKNTNKIAKVKRLWLHITSTAHSASTPFVHVSQLIPWGGVEKVGSCPCSEIHSSGSGGQLLTKELVFGHPIRNRVQSKHTTPLNVPRLVRLRPGWLSNYRSRNFVRLRSRFSRAHPTYKREFSSPHNSIFAGVNNLGLFNGFLHWSESDVRCSIYMINPSEFSNILMAAAWVGVGTRHLLADISTY